MLDTLDHRIIDRALLSITKYNLNPYGDLNHAVYVYGSVLRPLGTWYRSEPNVRFTWQHEALKPIARHYPHSWLYTDYPLTQEHIAHHDFIDVYNGGLQKRQRNPRYPLLALFVHRFLDTIARYMFEGFMKEARINKTDKTVNELNLKSRIAVCLGYGCINEWSALDYLIKMRDGKQPDDENRRRWKEDADLYEAFKQRTVIEGVTAEAELQDWSGDRELVNNIFKAMQRDGDDGNPNTIG